eukprot:CAMPEP_0175768778 /NCGR_PEP_ID=MMETSP0097-20121207/70609_1 /TAXON_ID=311494 /ORGANISM="Alexandrium monilatum, Strain CCMP3105" /LENGTH=207 /DNA_ID=CAMNT_0017078911 /DNA_START=20 /DNA_END=641 /DNA_ORIENTATION=-
MLSRPTQRAWARPAAAAAAALGFAASRMSPASMAPGTPAFTRTALRAKGGDAQEIGAASAAAAAAAGKTEVATFAMADSGGPQAQFDKVPGVVSTTVGYTGGRNPSPTYESVCGGDGHTEAIQIEYDPSQVSYDDLLKQFYRGHQPSPGKAQYKSAVWYHNEEQKQSAEAAAEATGNAWVDLDEAQDFHAAEEYHQKYYQKDVAYSR